MSWEQLKTMATCVSPQLSFCPVLKACSSHSLEKPVSQQLARAFMNAARSKHLTELTWFLLRCMCFRSDSTIALKSSLLIAGAEKPLPSFWHIYSSPTFASLEPSSPSPPPSSSQNLVHKRLLSSIPIFSMLQGQCSFHISQAHPRWLLV